MAVVGVAVLGRDATPAPGAVSTSPPAAVARAGEPSGIVTMPSPRSGSPSSVGARTAARPLAREEGTDGLMGRLPFGLPGDTPIVAAPTVEHLNRFTIDDVRTAWSGFDTTPPWVRRLGALGGYTTDPYER